MHFGYNHCQYTQIIVIIPTFYVIPQFFCSLNITTFTVHCDQCVFNIESINKT